MTLNAELKFKITDRQPVCGAFIKTPHPIVIEIMGQAGYDFLVLDAEHAPFDRAAIDTMMIAGRASGVPLIVRVPASGPEWIMAVLDAGAAGVMVPHVNDADFAARLVRATRYGSWTHGGRGFAGTTRAAEYAARGLSDHLAMTPDEITLICQIEDPPGAGACRDIAAVEGVDALFVGRADLAVGYGKTDFFDAEVAAKSVEVLSAQGAATGLYCAPGENLGPLAEAGATVFVIGSDHTCLKRGSADDLAAVRALKS
ncbi:HpcH/HpaI aldolase family protein [Tropicimonas sp. S265A]|uniref:HpcH/HpaI aldolase family protein n=1 Tax=Tropicimonas sp. S265A TaxID=3415134 RepID=UPI003C7A4789